MVQKGAGMGLVKSVVYIGSSRCVSFGTTKEHSSHSLRVLGCFLVEFIGMKGWSKYWAPGHKPCGTESTHVGMKAINRVNL